MFTFSCFKPFTLIPPNCQSWQPWAFKIWVLTTLVFQSLNSRWTILWHNDYTNYLSLFPSYLWHYMWEQWQYIIVPCGKFMWVSGKKGRLGVASHWNGNQSQLQIVTCLLSHAGVIHRRHLYDRTGVTFVLIYLDHLSTSWPHVSALFHQT